jgi:spermidine synthase
VRSLTFDDPDVIQTVLDPRQPHVLVSPYTRALASALCVNPRPAKVLIVGLGGGAFPTFLRHYYPDAHVTVVELDPEVIVVAKRFFAFKEDDRCRAVCADGRKFIEASKDQYDLIVLDAYGAQDIPRALATAEFLRAVQGRLAPGGVIAANISGPTANPLYDRMIATYHLVFGPRLHRVDAPAPSVQRTILVQGDPTRPAGKPRMIEIARRVQADLKLSFDLPALVEAGYHEAEAGGNSSPLLDADPQ